MTTFSRREALAGAALGVGSIFLPREAAATVMRGLSLAALSKASQRILVGTPLEANARWETLGGRRRIVTETRVRIDDMVHATGSSDGELLVRTLGGTVGDIAAKVHGEALLSLNRPCVVFLQEAGSGVHRVTAMAQGHYPVRPDEKRLLRLQASPQAPEMVGSADLAVDRLRGQELTRAKVMILEALRK